MNPGWYTFKSIALVGTLVALAYFTGRNSRSSSLGHRRRRR